jgi:hypothetical protein
VGSAFLLLVHMPFYFWFRHMADVSSCTGAVAHMADVSCDDEVQE